MTRRSILLAGAALPLIAGCGSLRHGITASARSHTSRILTRDYSYYQAVPQLQARYNATHSGSAVTTGSTDLGGQRSVYELQLLETGDAWDTAIDRVAIDGALRTTDFDIEQFPAQQIAGYRWLGKLYGLPVHQLPLSVMWRKDVFAAAGVPPPTPRWTWQEFISCCEALEATVQSNKISGLQAVIFPMLDFQVDSRMWSGLALGDPVVWSALAVGFGGTVVADGRFAVDSNGMNGLRELVDVARRFGAQEGAVPHSASEIPDMPSRYALWIGTWTPPTERFDRARATALQRPYFGQVWSYARFPALPIRPIITTRALGVGPALPPGHKSFLNVAWLQAAVDAITWLFTSDAADLLMAQGLPPVVGANNVQERFWAAQAGSDQAVGDWKSFLPYNAGWPVSPSDEAMGGALQKAVSAPDQLGPLVAGALTEMNAWLSRVSG